MVKHKISWITENFVDVDLPIINELANNYDISWFISQREDYKLYSNEKITAEVSSNVNNYIFNNPYRYRDIRTFFHYLKLLLRARAYKPDLYYIDFSVRGFLWFYPLVKTLIPRKKIVYAVHDAKEHSGMGNSIFISFLKRKFYGYINNFQFFSLKQKYVFTQLYDRRKKKNLYLTKLCPKNFGSPTEIFDIQKGYCTQKEILFFGSIRKNKGIDDLIDCINRLQIGEHQIKFNICGYTSDSEKLISKITNTSYINLDLRIIPDSEIPNLLNRMHYMILPYRDMTQSGIMLIAYQYGLPIIASNLEEFEQEIKDGENGFIYDFKNKHGFNNFIKKICDLKYNKYSKLMFNQKKHVESNYSLKSIVEDYKTCIDNIIK